MQCATCPAQVIVYPPEDGSNCVAQCGRCAGTALAVIDEWPERLAALVDQATARRGKRERIRAEVAERRLAGLRQRHATKLRRLDARNNTTGGDAA